MKFWKKLTAEERSEIAAVMKTTQRVLGSHEALRIAVHALIESHPDPARLRLELYPTLVTGLAAGKAHGLQQEGFHAEAQALEATLQRAAKSRTTSPAPGATDASP